MYERAKQDPPLTTAGKVDADTYWERITYFLERVVPVAEEFKVKMGCHPQDPGVPRGTGWRGVDAVLTERGPVPVSPDAKIIVALGTIESTHLALLSFGPDGKIGSNLIARDWTV